MNRKISSIDCGETAEHFWTSSNDTDVSQPAILPSISVDHGKCRDASIHSLASLLPEADCAKSTEILSLLLSSQQNNSGTNNNQVLPTVVQKLGPDNFGSQDSPTPTFAPNLPEGNKAGPTSNEATPTTAQPMGNNAESTEIHVPSTESSQSEQNNSRSKYTSTSSVAHLRSQLNNSGPQDMSISTSALPLSVNDDISDDGDWIPLPPNRPLPPLPDFMNDADDDVMIPPSPNRPLPPLPIWVTVIDDENLTPSSGIP